MENMICLAYIVGSDKLDGEFDKKLKQIDFRKLTHISVAFSLIKETDGKWLPCISDEIKSGINKIKAEINFQNADTKIILSIGGAMADGFCHASRTVENRKDFTDQIIDMVNEFSLDGIDIDWEFPGESMFGISHCENCKTDFILLLKELRNCLGSKLLTVAVGSNKYFGIDVKKLGEIVDYVLVMTYDLGIMHSSEMLSKIFITNWWILGIPKRKLCIGVPAYGKNVKNLKQYLNFSEVSKGIVFKEMSQSFSKYQGAIWCFDTEFDVEKKATWARQNGFGGVFCWEITGDNNNRILNAMHKGTFGE